MNPPEQPFVVPDFDTLSLQAPSPRQGCVVTLERVLHAWVIHEYTEPLSWNREWMYDDGFSPTFFPGIDSYRLALSQFVLFVDPKTTPTPREPDYWTRAIDTPNGLYRVRRAKLDADGVVRAYDRTADEKL